MTDVSRAAFGTRPGPSAHPLGSGHADLEGADRQPRRDRRPHRPGLPRRRASASVAVYADPDRDALHVKVADEAYALGGSTPGDTYLVVDKLLDVAAQSGADAVHPGYGFLAENAGFAQAVIDAGLTWIGPPPAAIDSLGDKVKARHIADARPARRWCRAPPTRWPAPTRSSRSPRSTGCRWPSRRRTAAAAAASRWRAPSRRSPSCSSPRCARRSRAFGRGECFVERYLDKPRHVETQCLADQHGNVVVVSTRDCSLQRRNQKLVEEAPAPFLTDEQNAELYRASKAILREAGYVGAGTCEFLVGPDGDHLVPRGQHPAAGRAPGDRGGHRHRPGARAVPHRRRRGARLRRPASRAATRSSSGSTARTPAATSCPPRAPSPRCRCRRPARACGSTPASSRATIVGGAFDSMLAKLIVTGAHPPAGARAVPPRAGRVRRRRACRRCCRSTAPSSPTRRSRPPTGEPFTIHTRWIETEFDNTIEPYAGGSADGAEPDERQRVVVEVGGRRLEVVAARRLARRRWPARGGGAAKQGPRALRRRARPGPPRPATR